MPSFLTNAEFLTRYDYRWVGKNITDTGVAADQAACLISTVISSFIAEASEMVVAAAAIGNRYSENDLTTYGGQLLKRLTADLTMGLILKRRARATEDLQAMSGPYVEAMNYLELLRRGERIFYMVPNVPEAGVGEPATMLGRPGLDPPNFVQRAGRYFGCLGAPSQSNWPWGS